jgi:pimeloyl-ACP methyl ester carboxylesterase
MFRPKRHAAAAILAGCKLLVLVLVTLVGGCARVPGTAQTSLKADTVGELREYLLGHPTDLDVFRLRGPFAVDVQKDHELRVSSTERFDTDLYLAAPAEKLPLLIFLHGYDSSKEAHGNQALHAASWGMHALSVQLPNKGSWVANGRTLARIAAFVHRAPDVLGKRVDVDRIILVGHSFGGSAVAIALAEGAPAAGGILLDPAAAGRDLPKFLQQIKKPVMVLGADEDVSYARNRDYFYQFIRGGVAELSIRGATHEDAQYPSEFALRNSGIDPHTTEESQLTFVSALTSAAFGLSAAGTFDYAWKSFDNVFGNGKFFNPRKK